jgi:hypothetical protein
MMQRKISLFTPVGLFALVAGILVRLYTHSNYSEFAAGFLIGFSLVLMVAGFVRQKRAVAK